MDGLPIAIGVHELAAMSERRIERLVNPAYSELPAFLVGEGGLNSGFMIAHCTAAALGKYHKTKYFMSFSWFFLMKNYLVLRPCFYHVYYKVECTEITHLSMHHL